MEEIFYISPHNTQYLIYWVQSISVQSRKTTKYGDKSLRALGPYLWNSLSEKN